MRDLNIDAVLSGAFQAVDTAREIVRGAASRPRSIHKKGRIDLVTETDLAVEESLKADLAEVLPQADFLAEETSSRAEPGDLTWIIDPLDGTTNFAHGLPFVAISVGLWRKDRVVLGIVDLPLLDERFHALENAGAYLNNERISVSGETDPEQALVATGFPYDVADRLDEILTNLRAMLAVTQGVRRPGAAALDLAYTACGRYDAFYEPSLKPWDTAAGWLLVTEAGGTVTQFDNTPYHLQAPNLLASNTHLHSFLRDVLK